MRKFITLGLCLAGILAVSTGCVHRTPFTEEYYFQAMGDPAELVVTLDMSKSDRLYGQAVENASSGDGMGILGTLLDRIDRVSMAFYEPDGLVRKESEAVDLSTYAFYGGIEGNIPRFITNTALLWTPGWEKVVNENTRYYRNAAMNLEVAVPKNGLLLFSQGDYMRAYNNTYAHRVTKIPSDLAQRMASSLFGFYVTSPRAILDIGLAIPAAVLMQMKTLLLMIEETTDGKVVLQGSISMNTERLAKSLSILMKTAYISDKRRNNATLGDLTNLFVLDEDTLLINNMDLSQEQLDSFTKMFGSLLSVTGGRA
jgi:hypothetical protein